MAIGCLKSGMHCVKGNLKKWFVGILRPLQQTLFTVWGVPHVPRHLITNPITPFHNSLNNHYIAPQYQSHAVPITL
jgi:hypothetical protein